MPLNKTQQGQPTYEEVCKVGWDSQIKVESLGEGDKEFQSEEDEQINSYQPGNPLADNQLTRDQERKQVKRVQRFAYAYVMAYAVMVAHESDLGEPSSYKEALASPDQDKWLSAMKEMESLIENNTWVMVNRSPNQSLIRSKWIFKRKIGPEGAKRPRYKAGGKRVLAKIRNRL